MAFTKSGNTITQTGVDANLSGLKDITGVTRTFEGTVINYHPGTNVTIDVEGTLTINGELNTLASSANAAIAVKNGGRLNWGEDVVSERDGSLRRSTGTVLTSDRAQAVWWGSECTIEVETGGTFVASGGNGYSPGWIAFRDGSHVWIKTDGMEWYSRVYNISEGQIDPITGLAVSNFVLGINMGTTNRLKDYSRGYIGWVFTDDIRVDGLTLIGGELAFGKGPASNNNTLSGTPNGFFGYKAVDCRCPVLIDAQFINQNVSSTDVGDATDFFIENVNFANAGNWKGIALQSGSLKQSPFTRGVLLGKAFTTNAAAGTELLLGSDVPEADPRNGRTYSELGRRVNFDITDGQTGDSITGGSVFYKDYNVNKKRLNLNGIDNTGYKTFIGALTDGALSTGHRVITKIVNIAAGSPIGGTSNDFRGWDRSSSITRTSGTVLTFAPFTGDSKDVTVAGDVFVFTVTTAADVPTTTTTTITATASQTAFSVNTNSNDTIVCRIKKVYNEAFIGDLRTKSGVEGIDTFDFVVWVPEYNPVLLTNTNLQDGTIGDLTITGNTLKDEDYSSTSSSNTTTATVDALYDHIKQRKSSTTQALATGIEYPTKSTLAVSKSGELLDIGSRTFATENSTSQYTISNSALSVHSTSFGTGTIFKGIKTTGSVNLTNINLTNMFIETTSTVTNLPTTVTGNIKIGSNSTGDGGHTFSSSSVMQGLSSRWTFTFASNTFNGSFNPDIVVSGAGNNTFNGAIDSDIDVAAGNSTFGPNFVGTGSFNTGSGNLTFDTNSDVSGVDLEVDSGVTINVFGKIASDFSSVSNDGTINYIADLGETVFSVASDLPSGRVILKLRGSAAGTNIADVTHTTGSTTTLLTIFNVNSGAVTYDMYYKPTNITTGPVGNREFYLTTFTNGANDGIVDSVVGTFITRHPDVLTKAAEAYTSGSETAAMTTVTTGTTAIINIDNTDTAVLNAPGTQKLILDVMDDSDYLNLLANNAATGDYINPLIQSGTDIDQSKITLGVNAAADGQQQITALSGSGTGTLVSTISTGGTPSIIQSVVITPNSAGISVPEVITGINDSATGQRVKDMRGNDLLGLAPQDPDDN